MSTLLAPGTVAATGTRVPLMLAHPVRPSATASVMTREAMGATVRKPLFRRLTPPVSLAIGARSSPSCPDRRIRLTVLRHPVGATLHQVAGLVEHGKVKLALLGATNPIQPEDSTEDSRVCTREVT